MRFNLTPLEDRLVPAGQLSELLVVDQIGWRTDAQKIAVFADPVNGQNSSLSYTPGNSFQVRRVSDDGVAYTGSVTQWNNGNVHAQSGDRAWQGDFSSLTTPGEYYLYDPTNDKRSYAFRIQADLFNDVLKTAGRVFFYQRSGFDKLPQYAGNWSHAASHLQEVTAQKIVGSTPQGAGTVRDVHGGWWDAGDYNKYVPFTTGVLWDTLSAYEWNPAAFTDTWNIPESGNGTPDVLDEIKWEMDWLLRMQLPNGSVLNRVGQTSYNVGSGPTADTQPHYYTGATTWATASFAASAAHASRVFAPFNAAYATTLRNAAELAWTYLSANTSMLPANGQDGGNLAAAAGSADASMDLRLRILASAELWRLTGTAAYKTFFEANYLNPAAKENGFHPLINNYFDPSVGMDINRALVTYSLTPGATTSIVNAAKQAIKNHIDWNILPNYAANDPYRGYMWDGHYTWGSNQLKASWANILTYAIKLNVGTATDRTTYRAVAEEYLHYFHGRNPMEMTYLTNMGSRGANVGADKMPWQVYHGWWPDGSTLYDGEGSTYGPAPGYVVGGSNQYFSLNWISPPYGQPAMKSFKDWNTAWNASVGANENSWEITEPAIYYQASYLLLLSQYATAPPSVANISVNGGATQRSKITNVAVTFSTSLDVALFQNPGAVTLTRTAGNSLGSVVTVGSGLIITPGSGTGNSITLTFSNSTFDGVQAGSLTDGRWRLAIPSLGYQSALNDASLRRLFGDADNNGTVDASDFSAFGTSFGQSASSAFDFDNNNTVDATDLAAFGNRFGVTL